MNNVIKVILSWLRFFALKIMDVQFKKTDNLAFNIAFHEISSYFSQYFLLLNSYSLKFTLYEKCPYSEFFLSVFSPNAGKYASEKLRMRTLFKQCY